uniref:Small ribosomal subunit protein uS3c n=1 Tax=Nitzschia sp. NIES-3576 TaxID=2083273 RepID=A0A2Z5ZAQ6_9STRA|nr:ribosomal protein S3 [Nitzschia sp. NIES-3576]
MGQKVHPIGFRLNINNENYKSLWYSNSKNYIEFLKEDNMIRIFFNNIIRKQKISSIKIKRKNKSFNTITINIRTGNPKYFLKNNYLELKNIKNNIGQKLFKNTQIRIHITEIKKFFLETEIIANLIAEQIEKRIHFKRVIGNILQKVQNEKAVIGIKILLSGRLNGAEIATNEWVLKGSIPLQTLKININYSTAEASTIYGIIGIKVWMFKKN